MFHIHTIKTTLCLIFSILFLNASTLTGQNTEIEVSGIIKSLNEALGKKQIESVEPFLSADFSISTLSESGAASWLKMILENEQTASSVEFLSDSLSTNGQRLLNVVFKEKSTSIKSIIGLDSEGKIEFVDYFDTLFGQSRYRKSTFVASFPFELEDNKMVLTIKLNDNPKPLRFLFDTGADGMAVDRTKAEELNLKIGDSQTSSVVGGQLDIVISRDNNVFLTDSVFLPGQSIGIFEHPVDPKYDGLIGFALAHQYITRIDFEKKTISLFTFGDFDFGNDGETVKISVVNGTASLPGSINIAGKKEVSGKFVLDTGAGSNFVGFSRFVSKNKLLISGFKVDDRAYTTSMGVTTPVYSGRVNEFKIGEKLSFNDISVSLQLASQNIPKDVFVPDGSIGIHLLKQFNLTIDLLRKQIQFVPIVK